MKKIVLAPDSFKGTMSSITICNIMEREIIKHFPCAEIIKIPIADGGEGTVDSILEAAGGEKIHTEVSGPYFNEIDAFYGILPDNKTAVIEMAAAAGLPLVKGRENPKETTTYGVGQLILNALGRGCRKIILGLGGSSTNDGGTGMAAALGVKFFDKDGKSFIPVGGTLNNIKRIDMTKMCPEISECEITGMCDVNNPMFGIEGAAYVYAPQKGADPECVAFLDSNLEYLSGLFQEQPGKNISQIPGTGAAGALGAGIIAFLGGKLQSGIETILNTVGFDSVLENADLVFTGEGKIDGQSLRGKVVSGVAGKAQKKNIPVIAVVGDIGDNIDSIYDGGITAIMSINRVALPFEKVAARSESDLALTMDTIMRMLKLTARYRS